MVVMVTGENNHLNLIAHGVGVCITIDVLVKIEGARVFANVRKHTGWSVNFS